MTDTPITESIPEPLTETPTEQELNDLRVRAADLREQLAHYNYHYSVLAEPLISDAEYDQLFDELDSIEKARPELITPDSPTQRVGSDLDERLPKVTHPQPTLSLSKAYTADDVRAWYERVVKTLDTRGAISFTVEPKFDGLTVVLTYTNGVLTLGATRGDGYIGDDVTANVRTIRTVPLRIPARKSADVSPPPSTLVIRGEVIILKDDFKKFQEKIRAELQAAKDARQNENNQSHERNSQETQLVGEPVEQIEKVEKIEKFINARNTASGALKQLDARITAARPLTMYAFGVVSAEGEGQDSGRHSRPDSLPRGQYETLEYLNALGFRTADETRHFNDLEAVLQYVADFEAKRHSLPFEMDGLVIKIDDLQTYNALGVVGKNPRGAIAYKFPPEEVTTKLVAVTVNVGRTGVLIPNAELEPVFVSGATIRQATLNNFEDVARKDVRVGDRVQIKRAGEVIPFVIGPIVAARDGSEQPILVPTHCPYCNTPVTRAEGDVFYICPNLDCPERVARSLEYFTSRAGMDIEGLGEKGVRGLLTAGLVKDESDLFTLTPEKLSVLEGYGELKIANLMKQLEAAKSRPLDRLIASLGISGIGTTVGKLLTRHFPSLDAIAAATVEQLDAIETIGPSTAQSIAAWFALPRNQAFIARLREQGLNFTSGVSAPRSDKLAGLSFVLTGTLPTMTRDAAAALITDNGGKVSSSVSKKTSYLVAGEEAGSKLDKARELNVKILDEDGLRGLLNEKVDGDL